MGVYRHAHDLVGQLASRVHVFQSCVVACTLRFHSRLVLVVLGANVAGTYGAAVARSGADRRPDVKRLLSQPDARHRGRVGSALAIPRIFPRCTSHRTLWNSPSLFAPTSLWRRGVRLPLADFRFALDRLRRHVRDGLSPHPRFSLELSGLPESALFRQSRTAFLDPRSDFLSAGPVAAWQALASFRRPVFCRHLRLLSFHFQSSGLGGDLLLWKPIFHFPHFTVYFRARDHPGGFRRLVFSQTTRAVRLHRRARLLYALESRHDLSVGHTSDPRSRANLFFRGGFEPVSGRSAPDLLAPALLFLPPGRHDAPDRGKRYRAIKERCATLAGDRNENTRASWISSSASLIRFCYPVRGSKSESEFHALNGFGDLQSIRDRPAGEPPTGLPNTAHRAAEHLV